MTHSPSSSGISTGLPEPDGGTASSTLRTSGALFLWLALQLAALAIAAFHFPLWAHAPESEDLLALQFLLVAQLSGSALLFPLLMGSWRQTVFITASSWPVIVVAGMLSAVSLRTIGLAAMFTTFWLLALAVITWAIQKQDLCRRSSIRPPLSSTGAKLIAVAMLSVWTIGGPLILFCRVEYFAGADALAPWSKAAFGPIYSVFSAVFDAGASSWMSLAIVWLLAIVLGGTRVLMTRGSAQITPRPMS